ncbi:MAG: AAA family ATPase, partial [Myxococcota bacterium]
AAELSELSGDFGGDPSIGAAPGSPRRTAPAATLLTAQEQRWVSVIVVHSGAAMASHSSDITAPTMELVDGRRETPPSIEFGGLRFEAVGDGSMVTILDKRDAATDQAAYAAQLALALHREYPDRDIALATGRARISQARPDHRDEPAETAQPRAGEVIERTVRLLPQPSMGANASGAIHIDELTAELLDGRFDVRNDGAHLVLRGARPYYEERTVLGRVTPFVGRRRELAMLQSTLDQCVTDHTAHALLVIGPPGRGKSRLCHEFLRQLDARDSDLSEVWTGQSDPMHADSPLYIVGQLLRQLVALRDADPLPIRQEKLRALVASWVRPSAREPLIEFLGELTGTPAPGPSSMQLAAARRDPLLMGAQLRRAVEDLLDAVTRRRPVAIILDDLHWSDRPSLDLFDRLLRNLSQRPLLILAFARPEIRRRYPRLWADRNLSELHLAPLTRRAGTQLARALLGPDIAEEHLTALVERASGNAFYLEELARSAAGGHWDWPDSVLAMIESRLESLDARSRVALRAASVFGRIFWRGGVAALVGGDPDEWLDRLVEQEWITESPTARFSDEREFCFRHALVREGAYGMLTDEDRALGHRLAAQWLEQVGASDPRALAEHFEAGGATDKALTYYLRAAEAALIRSDLDAARALAERGVRCQAEGLTLGTLKRILADVAMWQGTSADVARLYGEAMALLPRGTRSWYEAAGESGLAMFKMGAYARVEQLAARLRDQPLPQDSDPDSQGGRLVAMAKLAAQLYAVGRADSADSLLAEIALATGETGLDDPVVAAYSHLAHSHRAFEIAGDPAAA